MKAKIIATIGPSSIEKNILENMYKEGMSIARVNSAYGGKDQYEQIFNNLKDIDPKGDIKILFDIKNDKYLNYCKEKNIEMIAISFAEDKDQIIKVRESIPNSFIISKIESVKGVQNYKEILDYSDGIMVARGDLSKAVNLEKVPPLQKKLTKDALIQGKLVIAATEMLLSMVVKKKPTNAEASDVANAVFDGVHAVMLSEETAIGKNPVESVNYMRRIVEEAEKWCLSNICTI